MVAISVIGYCTCLSMANIVGNTAEAIVTARPITVASQYHNGSTFMTTVKPSSPFQPFRPSKQLFEQRLYDSDGIDKSFDISRTDKQLPNMEYKTIVPPYSNLFILPPEAFTYTFDENQPMKEEIVKPPMYANTASYAGHVEDAYQDTTNTEVRVIESPVKPKTHEIHYHKHKHLHEYDPDFPVQPIYKPDFNNDHYYKSRSQKSEKLKSMDYRNQQKRDINETMKENKIIHHRNHHRKDKTHNKYKCGSHSCHGDNQEYLDKHYYRGEQRPKPEKHHRFRSGENIKDYPEEIQYYSQQFHSGEDERYRNYKPKSRNGKHLKYNDNYRVFH